MKRNDKFLASNTKLTMHISTTLFFLCCLHYTTAWEYEKKIEKFLTSNAKLTGIVQISSSRTSFTQVTGKIQIIISHWSQTKDSPVCGPIKDSIECRENSNCGVNAAGTCFKKTNSEDYWNEELDVSISFELETPSLIDCKPKTISASTTVNIVNADCVRDFPIQSMCALLTEQITFSGGKISNTKNTKLNENDVIALESMLTADDELTDGYSFQIDVKTMLATSLSRYVQLPPEDSTVARAQNILSLFGIDAILTIHIDHLWSMGITKGQTGASLSMIFEWAWIPPPGSTSKTTVGLASGDISLMRTLSTIHKNEGATPCFGYHERDGNLCIVSNTVPSGTAWEEASKCTISEDESEENNEILKDGCRRRRRMQRKMRRRRRRTAEDENNADNLCYNNGVQYYNIHEGVCTTAGQDVYSNKNAERLICCPDLKICFEERTDRGKAAYKQKHGDDPETEVPQSVRVCRESCCEGTSGVGKCSGGVINVAKVWSILTMMVVVIGVV